MHLEKFQVDKIQNGRLSAIIHLDRPDTSRHKLLLSGAEWSIFNIHIIPEFRWFYI